MSKYILSIDQGTSSSRAIIFNKNSEIISSAQKEFNQIYPKAGWVEHDPEIIWKTTKEVIEKALNIRNISINQIDSIGITNQRETTVLWDKDTKKAIGNAIVWQDRRTAEICDKIKEEGYEKLIHKKTGLVVDAYFSATKIKWMLDNNKKAKKLMEKKRLLFGTIDSWIVYKLTGGKKHITDYTNASRTMIFNINKLKWDEELLNIFNIDGSVLPEVKSSSEIYGYTEENGFLNKKIPIAGIAGDQQAATFGQTCFKKGIAKNTYGTGCFLLMNTGNEPVFSNKGLLTTIAWGVNGEIRYALEGSVFVAGAAIQWLRDEIKLLNEAKESAEMAEKVEDTHGVYVVPAFTGLGAPYWDMYARGAILGLTRSTNKNHIVRATLESIAYQTKDVLDIMEQDSNIKLKELRVDGGAANNDFLMQFQSNILNTHVEKPVNTETTALGAAYFAGLATGFWNNKEELIKKRKVDKMYEPDMEKVNRKKLYSGWKKAVKRAMGWEEK